MSSNYLLIKLSFNVYTLLLIKQYIVRYLNLFCLYSMGKLPKSLFWGKLPYFMFCPLDTGREQDAGQVWQGGGGASNDGEMIEPRREYQQGLTRTLVISRVAKGGRPDRGRGGRNKLAAWGCSSQEVPGEHIWELPVLSYHSIRGNYHYPFLGVIFRWFCMILLDKITIKTSQIVTLFSS